MSGRVQYLDITSRPISFIPPVPIKLKHYYHMYADGKWQTPLQEHVEALQVSGLMTALDFIGVGLVGSPARREELKLALPSNFEVVAEADKGWEQVTQDQIDTSEPAYILYAHTKGASDPSRINIVWRQSMTNLTVYGWKQCVCLLGPDCGYDAVGGYWQNAPHWFFAGTFWWATSDYLKTLPTQGHIHRHEAESWIAEGKNGGTFGDLCPGLPHPNLPRSLAARGVERKVATYTLRPGQNIRPH